MLYPLQVAHSRSSTSCCSATARCPLPVRAYNQTRGKNRASCFLRSISHLRIVIRKSHPVPPARLNPTAFDAEGVDAVLQQRGKQSLQFRTTTIQMIGIYHNQDVCFTVCSGAKQIRHARAQCQRLIFCSGLGIQLLYARPTQFAKCFTADQNLLPHGEIAVSDFLDETNCSHENQPP